MNEFLCSGRMTKDVEPNDSGKMARGTIAIDRPFPFNKDKDGNSVTDFLTLRFIGEKNVNRAAQYLVKGIKIIVRGVLCRDSWKDGDNWKELNYIIVNDWEFAESKNANGGGSSSTSSKPINSKSSDDDFMNINDTDDEEVPF